MTHDEAAARYPALMAYIASRSAIKPWFDQLNADEAAAADGSLSDVAGEMARADSDFAAQEQAQGRRGYPYNRDMGLFLGLPIRENGEPPHGYYMARRVRESYAVGIARREAAELIAAGKFVRVAIARDKGGKALRCAKFEGDQITLGAAGARLDNGKRILRIGDTGLSRLAAALRSGLPYGEGA